MALTPASLCLSFAVRPCARASASAPLLARTRLGHRRLARPGPRRALRNDQTGGTAGSSNFPLRGEKHSIWEGGVRGAAFVCGWGISRSVQGTVSEQLLHGADWLPTLVAGVAGGSTTGTLPLDGINQWEAISEGSPSARYEVVYGHEDGPWNCGLRNGSWKLLRAGGDKPSQYDPPGYGLGAGSGPAETGPGMATVAGTAACGAASFINGSCFKGNDLHRFPDVASAQACCARCSAAGVGCAGFTWHTDNRNCFLKGSMGVSDRNAACVSGHAGAGPHPGPPSPSPSPSPAPSPPVLLFDLSRDPYEHNDISSAKPAVVAAMLARLHELDQNLHQAGNDDTCGPRKPHHNSVVGPVWLPWC